MSDSSDDEDFAFYGNPLDPIDEDVLVAKKPVQIHNQVAKDEHGRRRFHGAFTGGFSAGFFNSVGSLEDWKPSGFISSRNSKAESKLQRAEDFMDEEDKGEFGICPTSVKVQPIFERKSDPPETIVKSDGLIPGTPILHQLLKPVNETIGTKLLMKMGWKPGQGVGPRLPKLEKRRRKKEFKEKKKVYGCSMPENFQSQKQQISSDHSSSDDEEIHVGQNEEIVFAPDDYEEFIVYPKKNFFGLGYSGLERHNILSSNKQQYSKLTVDGKTIRGQAFGVGALEEDDEDIYNTEDMSQYDFSLDNEDSEEIERTSAHKSQDASCIKGFHVAKNPPKPKEAFPLVTVPADFKPIHIIKRSRFEEAKISKNLKKRLTSNVQERSCVLGENNDKQIPSTADENSLLNNPSLVDSILNQPDTESVPHETLSSSKLKGFKPFLPDAEKQARYDKFLLFEKLGLKDKLRSIQPKKMTDWECDKEKTEFEKASKLYRPLSADLATRFTTGKQLDDTTSHSTEEDETENLELKTRKDAAEKEMFGPLTRRVYKWIPCKLMCKRFNVPEPDVDKSGLEFVAENIRSSKRKTNIFNILLSEDPFETKSSVVEDSIDIGGQTYSDFKDDKIKLDIQEQPPLLEDIPMPKVEKTIDLFKAIFLSSSEEEESDDDAKNSNTVPSTSLQSRKEDNPNKSPIINPVILSPPRGIFANLDLDILNSHKVSTSSDTVKNLDGQNLSVYESFYGPKLPDTLKLSSSQLRTADVIRLGNRKRLTNNDESAWVEKLNKRHPDESSHKRHKKEKRKKHKKDRKKR